MQVGLQCYYSWNYVLQTILNRKHKISSLGITIIVSRMFNLIYCFFYTNEQSFLFNKLNKLSLEKIYSHCMIKALMVSGFRNVSQGANGFCV